MKIVYRFLLFFGELYIATFQGGRATKEDWDYIYWLKEKLI
jgi:hypothetical protein